MVLTPFKTMLSCDFESVSTLRLLTPPSLTSVSLDFALVEASRYALTLRFPVMKPSFTLSERLK